MPLATWTNPRTWTSIVVTAPNLNEQIRDNELFLYGERGNVRAVVAKTATYTVVTTDGAILCNGTFTLTLPPAATAGANFVLVVKNNGTGVITLDGNGAETIDGALTFALEGQYAAVNLLCDGSGWSVF